MKTIFTLILCCIFFINSYSQDIYEYIQFDTGAVRFDLVADTQHIWQVGPPQKSIFNSAITAPNVLITDTILPYANNTNAYTKLFIYNKCWGIHLNFKYKIDSEKYRDGLKIEMSNNNINWYNIAYRDSFDFERFENPLIYNNDYVYTGERGISGSDSLWREFKLTAIFIFPVLKSAIFPRFTDSIWFKFTFLSDSVNTGEGFMLDSFNIIKYCGGGNIQNIENTSISIYPNPVQNILHIENELNQYYKVKIYNAQSSILKQFTVNKYDSFIDIDIVDYPQGMYLLQFRDEKDEISYKKFIKL